MEARQVEDLVSGFEMDQLYGAAHTADDYNSRIADRLDAAAAVPGNKIPAQRRLSEDEIATVGSLRADLIARWNAVKPGEALELEFDRSGSAISAARSKN